MRRVITSGLMLVASCGARLSGNPAEVDHPDAAVDVDAAMSDMALDAMQVVPWSTPAKVGPAATAAAEDDVTLSSNGLEMIFAVAATSGKDLYYTSRATTGAAWTMPATKLPFDTTDASEEAPRFSIDDQTLYFASDRIGGSGLLDIYSVKRAAAGTTTWGKPALVAGVNTAATEKWFAPCGTAGRYVVVRGAGKPEITHLFEGTLGGGSPTPIATLNSATTNDTGAFLTQDCLTIYFASARVTPERIFVSHRATVGDPWQPPTEVDDYRLTGTDNQEDPWLSPDGKIFAFASNAAGTDNKDIYLSTR